MSLRKLAARAICPHERVTARTLTQPGLEFTGLRVLRWECKTCGHFWYVEDPP